nr:MAG TPA: hypothetical protein [Caudoviricetes sp.]
MMLLFKSQTACLKTKQALRTILNITLFMH